MKRKIFLLAVINLLIISFLLYTNGYRLSKDSIYKEYAASYQITDFKEEYKNEHISIVNFDDIIYQIFDFKSTFPLYKLEDYGKSTAYIFKYDPFFYPSKAAYTIHANDPLNFTPVYQESAIVGIFVWGEQLLDLDFKIYDIDDADNVHHVDGQKIDITHKSYYLRLNAPIDGSDLRVDAYLDNEAFYPKQSLKDYNSITIDNKRYDNVTTIETAINAFRFDHTDNPVAVSNPTVRLSMQSSSIQAMFWNRVDHVENYVQDGDNIYFESGKDNYIKVRVDLETFNKTLKELEQQLTD